MTQRELNIEDLSTHILEEIFLFVSDRKNLRLVSKKFNEVVENSQKLMQKYALNVSKITQPYLKPINSYYQALKFQKISMNFDEFKWINCYRQKDRINSISIAHYRKVEKPEKFAIFLQCILFNFTSLRELHLDLDYCKENAFPRNQSKLISNEMPSLEVLEITDGKDINGIIDLFSDIQSIKTLRISDGNVFVFPQVVWNLEEFTLSMHPAYRGSASDDCMKFLEKQKSSLKILKHDGLNLCQFAIENLVNLEILHVEMETDSKVSFHNDLLDSNDKLRCLTIRSETVDSDCLENILSYYKNVECLLINTYEVDSDQVLGPLIGIELSNLTHLCLEGLLSSVLMNVKMPNLKFLEISNKYTEKDPYHFCRVPPENFKNLEKLSYECIWRMKEVYQLVQMCPKLQHLNLGDMKDCEEGITSTMVNTILTHAHQLKYIGILENHLEEQNLTCDEFLSQIDNKNVILKVYDDFELMMREYWKMDFLD